MNTHQQNSPVHIPAWCLDTPNSWTCTSCQSLSPAGCTDCTEQITQPPVSDDQMSWASRILSNKERRSSMPVLLLTDLLRDCDTTHDYNGNQFPGVYPYWASIPSYCIAKVYLEDLKHELSRPTK